MLGFYCSYHGKSQLFISMDRDSTDAWWWYFTPIEECKPLMYKVDINDLTDIKCMLNKMANWSKWMKLHGRA